jgi:hypothetical protein
MTSQPMNTRLRSITGSIVGAAMAMLLCVPAAAQNCQSELAAVQDLTKKTRDLAQLVRDAEEEIDRNTLLINDIFMLLAVLYFDEPPRDDLDGKPGYFIAWERAIEIWVGGAIARLVDQRRQAAAAGTLALRQYTNTRALLQDARLKYNECLARVAPPPPPPPPPPPQPPPVSGDGQICAITYRGWSIKEGRTSTMVVSPGHACSRTIGISTGQRLNGVVVTSAPRNGRATVSGFTVTYRSNGGYRGTDTFTTTVNSISTQGNQRSATIIWEVTVH